MATNQLSYQQLDELLTRLGFSRYRLEPKWLRYEHAESETEIILVERKPADVVRATDAWSAREHLLQKGLLSESEIDKIFGVNQTRLATARSS